jgi:hypothetical protein
MFQVVCVYLKRDEGGHVEKTQSVAQSKFTKVCEKERRSPAASPWTKPGIFMGILVKTRLVRGETRISRGERLFYRVAVSWIPAGETE